MVIYYFNIEINYCKLLFLVNLYKMNWYDSKYKFVYFFICIFNHHQIQFCAYLLV